MMAKGTHAMRRGPGAGCRRAGWLAAALLVASTLGTARGEEPAESFYHAGGKRIPLRIDPAAIVVKLTAGEDPAERALAIAGKAGIEASAARSRGPASERLVVLELPQTRAGVAMAPEARRARALSALGALAAHPEVEMASARYLDGAGLPMIPTGKLAVGLVPGVGRMWLEGEAAELGAEVLSEPIPGAHIFVLGLRPGAGRGSLEAANALHDRPEVRFSHPDFVVRRRLRSRPSDPLFPFQWHLENTGQDGAKDGADVSAPGAWDLTMGSESIRIAVIDEGVDLDHPEFAGKLVEGNDLVDEDGEADEVETGGHGTSVAGVAAAAAGNGEGGSGIAPGILIVPIRLLGPGGETTLLKEATAFRWAADHGADVINASWGPEDTGEEAPLPDIVRAGIDYAADQGRGGRGCLIFFAAGNGGGLVSLDGYASYRKVLAVAASTDQDRRASYSDYGPEIALAAPSNGGVTSGVWTADSTGREGFNPGRLPPGRYYVGVSPFQAVGGPYTLRIGAGGATLGEDEPNGSLAQANLVPYPSVVTGTTGGIDLGTFTDHLGIVYADLFAVDLPGGDVRIQLDVQGIGDLDLGLMDPDGFARYVSDRPSNSDEEIRTVPVPGDDSGDNNAIFGGTSSAAPLAAGVAALVLSIDPTFTRAEVAAILEETADKIDSAGGAYDESGHSPYYGYGRVNAERAVRRAANLDGGDPPANGGKRGGGGGGCAIGAGSGARAGGHGVPAAPWVLMAAALLRRRARCRERAAGRFPCA